MVAKKECNRKSIYGLLGDDLSRHCDCQPWGSGRWEWGVENQTENKGSRMLKIAVFEWCPHGGVILNTIILFYSYGSTYVYFNSKWI